MPDTRDVAIADIVLGPQSRETLPHVETLAESLRSVGLINPVTLNTRYELIAGHRRVEAAKRCGWKTILARIVDKFDDALAALHAERDENTCREPLTLTEYLAMGRRIEAMLKPEAKERQREGGGDKKSRAAKSARIGSGKFPEPISTGKVTEKVVEALGPQMSARTFEKGRDVLAAAERDRETYGHLPAVINERGVDPAFKEMKRLAAGENVEVAPQASELHPLVERLRATWPQLDERSRNAVRAIANDEVPY